MNSRKWLLYLFLFLNLAVILYFWTEGSGGLLARGSANTLIAFGRLAGLLTVLAVMLQIVAIGRVRWLEPVFGLDRLSRFHHYNGVSLVCFLVLHPLLLAAGHGMNSELSMIAQLVAFLDQYDDIIGAIFGLFVFLFVAFYSVLIRRGRWNYEFWYLTHLTVYAAVALAFGHQLEAGGDFLRSRPFSAYWLALYVFAFGNLLVFRFLKPLWMFLRHDFTVTKVVSEAGDATSVYIGGKELESFQARPGQFAIFRFLSPGQWWWQAHPFSISKKSNGEHLRITVKAVGDYTKEFSKLTPGTKVIIDGPHGVFTADRAKKRKFLLIAGGIGITPIRAMLDDLAGKDVVLLYGNRRRTEAVFTAELDGLARTGLTVHHVISDDPSFEGEKGRIDKERIARLVPDARDREVFLCGPVPMMDQLRVALEQLGVPKQSVHYEKFSLS